jgi:hypothetical protein
LQLLASFNAKKKPANAGSGDVSTKCSKAHPVNKSIFLESSCIVGFLYYSNSELRGIHDERML